MRFLDVFNEIQKGDYALTDEAVYHSLQNGDELIPLYGGNKSHNRTDRKISITAKTKKGVPITVFWGEGIIISLDGSAGSMTYKCNEQFSLDKSYYMGLYFLCFHRYSIRKFVNILPAIFGR